MSDIPNNKPLDYKSAGVDYAKIDPLKIDAQRAARETAAQSRQDRFQGNRGLARQIGLCRRPGRHPAPRITECLGTKVLIADAMRPITGKTYFDALAQDTLAMAINDIITVGATPVSVQAYWAAGSSAWFDDKERARDLVQGWKAACDRCGVSWGGGETPSLVGVVNPDTIDLAASCIGVVRPKERLTIADKLAAGDAIVLLAASGIHANGVSLARKVAAETAIGYRAKLSDGRLYGEALLDPTVLYSPVTEALFAAGIVPHYCANITGHGWRKVMRHPAALTYRFHTIAPVPPVLKYLQQAARHERRRRLRHLQHGRGLRPVRAGRTGGENRRRRQRQRRVAAWVAGTVEGRSEAGRD